MRYSFILAAAVAVALTAPTAAAELKTKGTKSQGSLIGVYSSQVTGNGAAIGGGTKGDGQTQEPGSRADEVQKYHALEGRGRDTN